ncbi:MAG TPA: hypothetical protein VGO93_01300 [Candidatus Xenobia bacterium]|jgi:DNA polymerase III delta subunit
MTPYIDLLRAGRLTPARTYLLVGTDATVHHDVVTRLTRGLVQNPELNFVRVRAGEQTRFEDILAEAEAFPMLSKRRLVWVDALDRLSAAVRANLAAWLPDVNSTTTLVLSVGPKADGRKPARGKKEEGASPEEVAERLGVTIQCELRFPRTPWDKSPDDRPAWLGLELERRNLAAPVDARQALLGRLGGSLGELRCELDKLQAWLGKRAAITVADVEAVVCRSAVGGMQELSGLLQRKDSRSLLRLYRELIDGGVAPFQILSYAGSVVRGTASPAGLRTLVEAEVAAKSGTDPTLAVELALVQLCQPGLRSPDPPVMRPRR